MHNGTLLAAVDLGSNSFRLEIGLYEHGRIQRVDYLNTRENWNTIFDAKTPPALDKVGDLGPEGLVFIPAKQSPNGKPLLMVGNEVSGSTSVFQLNLGY